ncbi:transcription elongation factor GreAB [Caenimonas sedimenti]|uniref:Transcription elongation factor GreAB n=1 Tax=Caenimonas sedimenti TaxID=2596921 RepID=A0A562ZJC5_9BURK|nr:GreA/GreB family elongation factor [Caenimonas sedimenti]TWO68511.1 transcription elongation factor GreAB [Caenimonas sedimenti]
MAAVLAPERTLTQIDYVRLTRLLTEQPASLNAGTLDELLAVSELVASPSVAPDVVTMYSQIVVADETDGARMKIALCYPDHAEPAAGFISVLAPLGTALLGLRVGDVARWAGPGGQLHATRVVEMLFQPEATGDYTT